MLRMPPSFCGLVPPGKGKNAGSFHAGWMTACYLIGLDLDGNSVVAPAARLAPRKRSVHGTGVTNRKKSCDEPAGRIIWFTVELPGIFVHVTGGAIVGLA